MVALGSISSVIPAKIYGPFSQPAVCLESCFRRLSGGFLWTFVGNCTPASASEELLLSLEMAEMGF